MVRTGKWFILISIFIFLTSLELSAATIILKNGATVKGVLIDKTDDTVTIQDQWTKQLRSINSDAILSLTLEAGEQKIVDAKKKKIFSGDNLLTTLQPTIGIMPGMAYPVGKIGSRISIGFGFNAFVDIAVPVKPDLMAIRFGLSVGYLYHGTTNTEYSSSIMHIPVNAYAKLQFLTSVGVRPYIKLGGGITPVLSGAATDMAPAAVAAMGLGYTPRKIPYMEFFIEAGYMMVFESIRGDFVIANIGVAYRFGAPAPLTLKPAVGK
jgi:hypothetical protein